MKLLLTRAAALLVTFVLGLASFHPVAVAMEKLAAGACSSNAACVAGANAGKGPGVGGSSVQGSGVKGVTTNASGTLAPEYGVSGYDKSTDGGRGNSGVYGFSRMGQGVVGESASGFAVAGITTKGLGVVGASSSHSASAAAVGAQAPNGAAIFVGQGSGTAMVTIDSAANITTTGQVFTSGSCSSGCVVRRHVRSYGTTAAEPTMEDAGEAQLRGGTAFVRLDPAFANAIDRQQSYLVLITPEGDTRGLFVAQRTPAGFLVRETLAGRSNTPFAYRIVAHPFGVRESRLPFVQSPARLVLPAIAPER